MIAAIFLGNPELLAAAYPPALRERIGRVAEVLPGGGDALEFLGRAEVVFSTWGMPEMDGAFLEAAPRLRAVFYAAGSVKKFLTEAAAARGVVVCSGWGANAIPVCEYTVSVIRLALKRFFAYARATRLRKVFARDLPVAGGYGSSVGIVSLGAIGRLVVKALAGGDLRLLAYDPLVDDEDIRSMGAEPAALEEIFSRCDVVSLHVPWLPETEGMVGGSLLRLLKPGATIINTARGAVVDEAALVGVLSERPDLTAVLDVTHPEPPAPDSPLFTLENVVLTPHIAGSMGGEIERMGLWMVEDFERWLRGEPLRHVVDPGRLSVAA